MVAAIGAVIVAGILAIVSVIWFIVVVFDSMADSHKPVFHEDHYDN